MADAAGAIGIFDSGVGGLAVLAEVRRLLPHEPLIYYADQAYFPYGPRPQREVLERSDSTTRELLDRGCKMVVVACNTATSAAVAHLRQSFDIPFVSIEPALKPAAQATVAGRVALLMTPGTARGEKLSALIDRYGAEVHVLKIEAPGLAERVEAGDLDGEATRALLRPHVDAVLKDGADVIALGCTHYAFVRSVIEELAGEGVTVLEPSAAVAKQVARVLQREGLNRPGEEAAGVVYLTSGDAETFARQRARLRDAGAVIPIEAMEAAH